MTRGVIDAARVASVPWAAGHFWMYAQYVDGLGRLGCDVWWLEELPAGAGSAADEARVETLRARLRPLGVAEKILLYRWDGEDEPTYLTCSARRADQVLAGTDLLLNFHYEIAAALLGRFRRTALVDIDPGMLQLWWRQVTSGFTSTTGTSIGEHLDGSVPGVTWTHTAPAVSLDLWPYRYDPASEAFTSVSSWRTGAYVALDGTDGAMLDSNKQVSYLELADLPRRAGQRLELASVLGPGGGGGARAAHRPQLVPPGRLRPAPVLHGGRGRSGAGRGRRALRTALPRGPGDRGGVVLGDGRRHAEIASRSRLTLGTLGCDVPSSACARNQAIVRRSPSRTST